MTESRETRSGRSRSHDTLGVPLWVEVSEAFEGQRDGTDRDAERDFGRSGCQGFVGGDYGFGVRGIERE